ncbi:MAG: hypothetical protein K5745_02230 [Saccharofermentans sp.]|nr:hypothetical protein [Saccharofermentans sp.]
MSKQKSPVAIIVLSILSVSDALIALLFAILFMMTVTQSPSVSGDYITNEAVVFAVGYITYLMIAIGGSALSFITGLIGMILSIVQKRFKLIWLPAVGLILSIVSFVIVCIYAL